jgi:hypothetical protein
VERASLLAYRSSTCSLSFEVKGAGVCFVCLGRAGCRNSLLKKFCWLMFTFIWNLNSCGSSFSQIIFLRDSKLKFWLLLSRFTKRSMRSVWVSF